MRAAPHLAATVVVLRPGPHGPEVLLIRRPASMAFAGGMYAFPGGRVDPDDHDPASLTASPRSAGEAARVLGRNVDGETALSIHLAAVRELREEAGITVPTDRLAPIAQWTTPTFMPRRFSTWFFVADLPAGAEPVFAADEVDGHAWLTPADALDHLASGQIGMWVPTTSVLERLLEMEATDAAGVARRLTFATVAPPRVVTDDETVVRLELGAAGALPGRSVTTTVHGRRELVVVDPGDPSEEAVDAIEAVAKRRAGSVRAIVLTRTDPDHAAAAEAIAIPREAPVLVAPGAGRFLPYETREVEAGERLPSDVDLRVRLGPAGSGRLTVEVASAGE